MIVARMFRLSRPTMVRTGAMLFAVSALLIAACTDPKAPEPEARPEPQIELIADVTNELEPPAAPAGSVPVAVGLFMSLRQIGPAQAVPIARKLVDDTNERG